MKNSEKLIFIDYLKSFSMLYIVGYWHLFDYTSYLPLFLYPASEKLAFITLGLFTFISGFLSAKSVIKTPKVTDFYIKRIVRIYPLYLVAVVWFFIYGLKDGLPSFFKSLFLVSMLYGPAPRTLWFITMIMLFYLTAPFLVKFAANLKKYILFVAFIMAFVMIFKLTFKTADIRLFLYFPCFCVGIYCAINGMENQLFNIKNAIIVLIVGLLSYLVTTDSGIIEKLKEIPWILSASYLIFLASYRSRAKFTKIGFVAFLSYSSYAMYLFHRPIYKALKALYFPENGVFQILYLVGFCLVVIALTSWVFQWVNDRLYKVTSNLFKQKVFGNL